MKFILTLIFTISLPALAIAQSSSVNPGTTPANSTTTTGDVASDQTTGKKTIKEHIVEKSHNVKRAVKKGAHQMREMTCRKVDQKCLALKEKHRAMEQAEYHRDKLSESENSIQQIESDTDTTP
jgi:hypothetical protein